METQTRYDLNAAVESWRQELAAQASLTAEVRRELEMHLRDTIAGFQQRGLNDEDSFWLARRRVGQPQKLGEEFEKADPTKVWRDLVFWMASAILLAFLWNECAGILSPVITNPICNLLNSHMGSNYSWFGPMSQFSAGLLMALRILPLFVLVVLLAKGRLRGGSILRFFERKRFSILMLASLWIIASGVMIYLHTTSYNQMVAQNNNLIESMSLQHGVIRMTVTPYPAWTALFYNLFFPLLLLTLVVWLQPTQNQKTPKSA